MVGKTMTQGLTLIEVMTVIAIIAALVVVIMPRLSPARDRAVDAFVQSNFSTLRAKAALIRNDVGTYDAVCNHPEMSAILNSTSQKVTGNDTSDVCLDDTSYWVAAVPLKRQNQISDTSGTDYWCVDHAGAAKIIDTQITTETACP